MLHTHPHLARSPQRTLHCSAWLAALVAMLVAMLAAAAGANADTVSLRDVHYDPARGAFVITVRASGPPDTAIATNLYPGHCPDAFAEEDVKPGVSADGLPHVLLANPPAEGPTSGKVALCLWTIHFDQSIALRYEQQVTLPAQQHAALDPTAGTHHPLGFRLAGWSAVGLLVLLALAAFGARGLLARGSKRARRNRRHGVDDPGQQDNGEALDAWRQAGEEAAKPLDDPAEGDPLMPTGVEPEAPGSPEAQIPAAPVGQAAGSSSPEPQEPSASGEAEGTDGEPEIGEA